MLPVTTSGKTIEVEFIIINKLSAYNAILGRDWLHRMDAGASTRCQMLKFISNDGMEVMTVWGEQLLSKELYTMEIRKPTQKAEDDKPLA